MQESLGKTLRRTRESAGITVDDAVYLAKIPRSVVIALEAEDFGFFTSPLYARSFLRQYSEYIGADVELWIDDLVPATMIDGEAVESFIDISEPVAAAVTRQESKSSSGAWAAIWLMLLTAGLGWGGLKIYENFETNFSETSPEQPIEKADPPGYAVLPAEDNQIAESENEPEVEESGPEPPKRAIIVNFPEE